MPKAKKRSDKKTSDSHPSAEPERKVCFVISPIGKKGTDHYTRFREVLDYVIKSAVKASGYELEVLRADDIDRAGSFIKDILESLYSSFVVIADLTEQNPNVFYELGVRHSLRPRTILIAQSVDDIPSDLREYRSIVYDTSAKGAANFTQRLKGYLSEIHRGPDRADNPVLDRLGNIIENRINLLEAENLNLKNELTKLLQTGVSPIKKEGDISINTRVNRIVKLMNAERQVLNGHIIRGEKEYILPGRQGDFLLYFVQEGEKIMEIWYLAIQPAEFNYQNLLADTRVLMENCIQQGGTWCKFIIATPIDLTKERKNILSYFNKMKEKIAPKHRKNYSLEVWDEKGISDVEKEHGLRV